MNLHDHDRHAGLLSSLEKVFPDQLEYSELSRLDDLRRRIAGRLDRLM